MSPHIPSVDSNSLDLSLGAIEVGVLISTVLYGNLLVQAYVYYCQSRRDRIWTKLTVLWCLLIESLHTGLFWLYVYYLTVTFYGVRAKINHLCWHVCAAIIPQAITAATVQATTSYRVYLLSGNIWYAIPAWIAQLGRVALSLFLTVMAYHTGDLSTFVNKYNWVVIVSMTNSALIDIANSVLLCYHLHSRLTGFRRSTAIIHRLMIFSIETGVMTSTIAILLVVFIVVMPYSGVWLALFIIYSKVYTNSLLVVLNDRENLRESTHGTINSLERRNMLTLSAVCEGRTRPIDISVDIETTRVEESDNLCPLGTGELPLKSLSPGLSSDKTHWPPELVETPTSSPNIPHLPMHAPVDHVQRPSDVFILGSITESKKDVSK